MIQSNGQNDFHFQINQSIKRGNCHFGPGAFPSNWLIGCATQNERWHYGFPVTLLELTNNSTASQLPNWERNTLVSPVSLCQLQYLFSNMAQLTQTRFWLLAGRAHTFHQTHPFGKCKRSEVRRGAAIAAVAPAAIGQIYVV